MAIIGLLILYSLRLMQIYMNLMSTELLSASFWFTLVYTGISFKNANRVKILLRQRSRWSFFMDRKNPSTKITAAVFASIFSASFLN